MERKVERHKDETIERMDGKAKIRRQKEDGWKNEGSEMNGWEKDEEKGARMNEWGHTLRVTRVLPRLSTWRLFLILRVE